MDSITDHPADYVGECDRCHDETALWIDHTQPGEFAYCRKCTRKYEAKRAAKTSDRVSQIYRLLAADGGF